MKPFILYYLYCEYYCAMGVCMLLCLLASFKMCFNLPLLYLLANWRFAPHPIGIARDDNVSHKGIAKVT